MFPSPVSVGYSIYGAPWCKACREAKEWCYKNNDTNLFVNVEDYEQEEDLNHFENMKNEFGKKTLPLIFKDGKFIGGWDDLQKTTKLDDDMDF